ncbi:hypothetical protein [Micromonospora rosaria]|uniref:hypothetical protein n=1 Tax=Micromonospora rosaria TaxID=47874 RepID=UPI0037C93E13
MTESASGPGLTGGRPVPPTLAAPRPGGRGAARPAGGFRVGRRAVDDATTPERVRRVASGGRPWPYAPPRDGVSGPPPLGEAAEPAAGGEAAGPAPRDLAAGPSSRYVPAATDPPPGTGSPAGPVCRHRAGRARDDRARPGRRRVGVAGAALAAGGPAVTWSVPPGG